VVAWVSVDLVCHQAADLVVPEVEDVAVAEAVDGAIIAASAGNQRGRVVRLSPSGTRSTLARYRGEGTHGTLGIANESDGSVLVASGWGSLIQRVDPGASAVTVAGSGHPGFAGDHGPATAASLDLRGSRMAGIGSLPDGGLLFTDVNNNRVRRVRPDGAVETVAGSGPHGLPFFGNSFGGDGGLATAARLFAPQEVLPTRGGGFLVSDTGNARVRKVNSQGIITTFAGEGDIMRLGGQGDGGPAIRASITRPTGLARLSGKHGANHPSGTEQARRHRPLFASDAHRPPETDQHERRHGARRGGPVHQPRPSFT
jgi:hypothetical protein